LEVPVLSDQSQARLREFLAAGASSTNPVDMIASATAVDYRKAIEILAADENVDALIVIFTPPLVTSAEDVARAIVEAARDMERRKPLMSVFLSGRGAPSELHSGGIRIPTYSFPESAAIALARASRYREWRDRPESTSPVFADIQSDRAAAVVARALTRGDVWLTPDETAEICACYGLPLVEQKTVTTADEAGVVAAEMDAPVALKIISPGLLHKTEAGAVRLNLRGAKQVSAAAREMGGRLESQGHTVSGFVVQRMAEKGIEMLVGVVHDPQFGPVVACGAGGVQVELLRDVSVRLTPLSNDDAAEMIRNLKTYPLLTGFRGGIVCDTRALQEGLLRVSAMVEDLPQIAELDCNPFVVFAEGAAILDARIRVSAVEPRPLLGVRR
jgi:acyl-CoA synthetase (NDP forming)